MATNEAILARLQRLAEDAVQNSTESFGELTIEVSPDDFLDLAVKLRDDLTLRFEQLIDLCGVDYQTFGHQAPNTLGSQRKRFAAVYHLLSVTHNHRLRVRVYVEGEPPIMPSAVEIWNSANWYEREAFDLFGIVFEGHSDLRRILTDYGFIGHPFRKDFPLSGHVEMRYDPDKGRVVYQTVTIEPRTLVPRVIREEGF
ncbi:MAG: NADH-quinone oxidoreductase subunit C, partial [Gammaproteobacteria bacterium]|nr:NADH-quinone oxidoreductase subunit C [Gammaproteobacteria bacterium]